jgi:hypothetical protein
METKESELTCEAKAAIRSYILNLIAVPGGVVTVIVFFLGFFIRDVAIKTASTDILDRLLPKVTERADAASSALAQALADAAAAQGKLKDAEKITRELEQLKDLQGALKDSDKLAGSVATELGAALAKSSQGWSADGHSGFLMVGQILICWGTAELKPGGGTNHTYPFKFPFPFAKGFAAPPAVSESIRTNGSGQNYNVYLHELTTLEYSGTLNEVMGRDAILPVVMSYVAIGKAVAPTSSSSQSPSATSTPKA